ncbi:hypothetical protein CPB85DRAFT_1340273 [Mucidula mucida]|nr:hypothetical protein CPB85DRAFT_1340273 [Mucidula mucida]
MKQTPGLPMALTFFVAVILYTATLVRSETHTISFDNQCGYGTPKLIRGNDVLTSTSFTANGTFASAIAYLDTGSCLFNGDGCTVVEMTLVNPTTAGSGSSVDITLIPPLAFSVPTSFQFTGVCSGQGASCATSDCSTAFFHPDDTWVQVACQEDNADLLISFCSGGSASSSPSSIGPGSSETTGTVHSTTSLQEPSSSINEASSTLVAAASSPSTSGYRQRPSCSQKRRSSLSSDRSRHSRRSRRHRHAGNGWA